MTNHKPTLILTMKDDTETHFQLHVPSSPMRVAPDHDAECSNECLFGETFVVSSPETPHAQKMMHAGPASCAADRQSQWIQVIAQRDSYTGYVEKSHLREIASDHGRPTHWVSSRSTLVFSDASIKSRILSRLPFLSRITSHESIESPFLALDTGGFVWRQHVLETGESINITPLELAQSHFTGTPYLWGGCTPEGVDCSGLVQALARAHGISIPRDSGDQEASLNHDVPIDSRQTRDIVYWPGHTGILVDPETLLHATAHSLSCVIEPLHEVVKRAGPASSVKRLFSS